MPRGGVRGPRRPVVQPAYEWAGLIEWSGALWNATPEAIGTDVSKTFRSVVHTHFSDTDRDGSVAELIAKCQDLHDWAYSETCPKKIKSIDKRISALQGRIAKLQSKASVTELAGQQN